MGALQTKEEMPPFEKLKAQARGICESRQEALVELRFDCTLAEVRSVLHSADPFLTEEEVLEVLSEVDKSHNVQVSTRAAVKQQYQAMTMRKEWRNWDEMLDESPFYIQQTDDDGNTLLHIALQHENHEASARLIKRGSMWNVLNNNRETAKTIASRVGNAQILALMLQVERRKDVERSVEESAQGEAEMPIETLQEMKKVIRRFSALL